MNKRFDLNVFGALQDEWKLLSLTPLDG